MVRELQYIWQQALNGAQSGPSFSFVKKRVNFRDATLKS